MVTYLIKLIKQTPHRNILERCLFSEIPRLNGLILDIGSKNRRYDFLMQSIPTAIDLFPNKEKNIVYGDIMSLEYEDKKFESVVCLEVLEYVDDPKKAISEMSRVLNDNGVLLLSTPFLSKYHGDRMRYTHSYLNEILSENFKDIRIKKIGNFYTVILDTIYNRIRQIKNIFVRILSAVLISPFILITTPFLFFKKDDGYASGYIIVAKK